MASLTTLPVELIEMILMELTMPTKDWSIVQIYHTLACLRGTCKLFNEVCKKHTIAVQKYIESKSIPWNKQSPNKLMNGYQVLSMRIIDEYLAYSRWNLVSSDLDNVDYLVYNHRRYYMEQEILKKVKGTLTTNTKDQLTRKGN
jgi:hypothetical protein